MREEDSDQHIKPSLLRARVTKGRGRRFQKVTKLYSFGLGRTVSSDQDNAVCLRRPMKSPSLPFPAAKGRRPARSVFHFLFLFHVVAFYGYLSTGQTVPATGGKTIHGVVKSGNMPIPGAGVTATDTVTKKQVTTSTDVDGSYSLHIPDDGRYIVRVQMPAFSGSTQEAVLDPSHQEVQSNFELVLESRARETANNEARNPVARVNTGQQQGRANAAGRGFQSLSVFQGEGGKNTGGGSMSDVAPSGMPVPGLSTGSATESVAVAGNTTNSFNSMSPDQMQQRLDDARQQGGGFGGGFGGP